MLNKLILGIFLLACGVACKPVSEPTDKNAIDPLASWTKSETKTAIVNYVSSVTQPESDYFIPVEDRIAVFDNDGTLWSEKPLYFQLFFILDRVKEMADEHPEWKDEQPFKAVLENDMKALLHSGEEGLIKLMMATHSGMSTEAFKDLVKQWAQSAKHPSKNAFYTDLTYQPMLELLAFLRAHDFKTYIVSGGGVDFMRALLPEGYGIPAEQVIGSTIKTVFTLQDGKPVLMREASLDFIDDKEGKPINIHRIIGKKPVFAAGNSDGDLAMLQYTASNNYPSFMLYVHHTDSVREWAYDRQSSIGRLDKGLDVARDNGWTLVNMEKDWKIIYPIELNP